MTLVIEVITIVAPKGPSRAIFKGCNTCKFRGGCAFRQEHENTPAGPPEPLLLSRTRAIEIRSPEDLQIAVEEIRDAPPEIIAHLRETFWNAVDAREKQRAEEERQAEAAAKEKPAEAVEEPSTEAAVSDS